MTGSEETHDHGPGAEAGVIRQQAFDVEGPLEVDITVGAGRIDVHLVDEPRAHVEVKHDPSAASPWMQGISNIMGWFAGQFGEQFRDQFGEAPGTVPPTEAVRETRLDLTGQRLVVRTPKAPALRHIPLAVTVTAPHGSHLDIRSGSARASVGGAAGRVNVQGGTGDIAIERADDTATIHTGSGAVRLGPMFGGLRARSGSGEIEVSSVGGSTSLTTGSGDVWLGAVQHDVMARTGSGDLTVADAASGEIELFTGSGEIRIAVRSGTAALVDLTSGSGQARSDLDVADSPSAEDAELRIRARTGSGNAVLTSAVVT